MIVTFLEDDILGDGRMPVAARGAGCRESRISQSENRPGEDGLPDIELKKLDIIVKPEQRIEDVYRCLLENGFFTKVCQKSQIRVYSVRQRAYVNPLFTFLQGRIYAGDILAVEISAC
ncbi:MAG: hypothetical protein K1W22_10370 [Lachnospiraceae bacterium]